MSRASVVLPVCFWLLVCGDAFGQSQSASNTWETVTMWKDGQWKAVQGDIRDINGASLLFEPAGELSVKAIPFSSIRAFTFTSDPAYARGMSSFGTKNYRAAQQHFEKALESESRDWAKAEILAQIAASMIADNRRADSLPAFQQIFRLAQNSRLLGMLPLVWDERLPESERLVLPVDRLTTADEISRVAIASCVLHDAEQQLRAVQVLKKLRTTSESLVISQLATAQLWRLSLLDTTDTVQMLTGVWDKQWRRMPASVRPGPGYVLGRCLQQQNEFDRAALVLLWSPFVQINDRAIAAASLKSGAECLQAAGRKSEADSVFRELIENFADQSAAR